MKEILEEMFDYFIKITKTDKYNGFQHLDYDCEAFNSSAPFLKEMMYFSYDVKNAQITLTAREGEIYSLDEIIAFNEKNGDYIKVSGVGNEVSSVATDPGCAVIEMDLNRDYFKDEILAVQKAVRLIDVVDTFDVYPIDLIKERAVQVCDDYNILEIYLSGDYASGNPTKNSKIKFIVDLSALDSFKYFLFQSDLKHRFKCDVCIFDLNDVDLNEEEYISLTG